MIDYQQTRARYDFSLLNLASAWNTPWTPRSHMSFQPEFRKAMKAIALCTHRLGWPIELVHHIGMFLNRDWWPDDRKECWNSECQIASISKATDAYTEYVMTTGTSKDSKDKKQFADFLFQPCSTLKPCLKCNTTRYCSKRCKENSYKISHKRCCSKPPCCKCKPTSDEMQLYRDLEALGSIKKPFFVQFAEKDEKETNGIAVDQQVGEDDDDNGSWESMDTNEDSADDVRATDIIYKFFSKNNYDA
jgi:hypothetical protein